MQYELYTLLYLSDIKQSGGDLHEVFGNFRLIGKGQASFKAISTLLNQCQQHKCHCMPTLLNFLRYIINLYIVNRVVFRHFRILFP